MSHTHRIFGYALLFGVICADLVPAATITVRRDGSGDFAVLQPALNAAAPGDTINIGPGEYTEYQMIRPPLWNWDLEIYAYITVDNLTLIGAGAQQTVIGPVTAEFDWDRFSPKCIYAGNVANLELRNLTVRNCYGGVYGPTERLVMINSGARGNDKGASVWGAYFLAEDCVFVGDSVGSTGIINAEGNSQSTIRGCTFESCDVNYTQVENFTISDCVIAGGNGGIGVYSGSNGTINNCELACSFYGIEVKTGGTCEIRDSHATGGNWGINIEGGQTSVIASSLVIENTVQAAVHIFGANSVVVNDSDLLPASGYAAEIYNYTTPPSRTYDFTRNYWGVTDTTAIDALIRDAHDSARIDDYIAYIPFASQPVPTEAITWGAVKALFK